MTISGFVCCRNTGTNFLDHLPSLATLLSDVIGTANEKTDRLVLAHAHRASLLSILAPPINYL